MMFMRGSILVFVLLLMIHPPHLVVTRHTKNIWLSKFRKWNKIVMDESTVNLTLLKAKSYLVDGLSKCLSHGTFKSLTNVPPFYKKLLIV